MFRLEFKNPQIMLPRRCRLLELLGINVRQAQLSSGVFGVFGV
jgi:hypothetical protein